jgi:excisionase family DNA binding protein
MNGLPASGGLPVPTPPGAGEGGEADPLYLTLPEVAGRLGIARGTAYAAAQRGELPFVRRIGHRIVVPLRALEAWEAGE